MSNTAKYQHQWRKDHPDYRNHHRAANYAQTRATATRAYRLWTQAEQEAVLKHDIPDRDLAVLIGRSVQAIHVKRSLLR